MKSLKPNTVKSKSVINLLNAAGKNRSAEEECKEVILFKCKHKPCNKKIET